MPEVAGYSSLPSLSVCIVTYERVEFLRRCLSALTEQAEDIHEVVVVDASAERQERVAAEAYPGTKYVHAPHLAGRMTKSRNEALLHVAGEVIAFLDDDVVVHPGWALALRTAYAETAAAAVSGRTLNHQEGEETYDRPIGRLLGDGTLTDGFAADAPNRIEVDHGIGANMSFRRSVVALLGGFRDDYPGTALREDTDMFLRVGAVGGLILFDPAAVVSHLPAPHVHGARFNTRYKLYGRRNHMVMLARARGAASPDMRRWITQEFGRVTDVPSTRRRVQRAAVTTLGVAWGSIALIRHRQFAPSPPCRDDMVGTRIRFHLTQRTRGS